MCLFGRCSNAGSARSTDNHAGRNRTGSVGSPAVWRLAVLHAYVSSTTTKCFCGVRLCFLDLTTIFLIFNFFFLKKWTHNYSVRFLIRQGSHVTLSSVFTINAPSEYHFEPTLQSGEQFEVFGTFGSVSGPQLGPVLSSELRDVGQVHEVYVSQSYTQRVGNRSSLVITRNDYVQAIPLEFRFTSVKNGGMSGVVCDGFSCRSEHNPYPLFEGWVRCALQPFGVWQLRDGEVRLPDSASTLLLSFTVICIATVLSLI